MSIKTKVLAVAGSLTLFTGISSAPLFASSSAYAGSLSETCEIGGQNNNGDCMNDWFGNTGRVYEYTAFKTNEDFEGEPVQRCGTGSAGYMVTSTCPFTDHSKDMALLGKPIYQIVHFDDGGTQEGCISDDSNWDGNAIINVNCNQTTYPGTGGGNGSLFVAAGNSSLVDVGWTNRDGGPWVQLESNGGSHQDQFYNSSNPTEWQLGCCA
jgi:hypothetical protein